MANKYGQHWIIDTASANALSANAIFVNAITFSGYAAGTDTAQIQDASGVLLKFDGVADLSPVEAHFSEPIILRSPKVPVLSSGQLTIFLA